MIAFLAEEYDLVESVDLAVAAENDGCSDQHGAQQCVDRHAKAVEVVRGWTRGWREEKEPLHLQGFCQQIRNVLLVNES